MIEHLPEDWRDATLLGRVETGAAAKAPRFRT
jgi:hypothetical protein